MAFWRRFGAALLAGLVAALLLGPVWLGRPSPAAEPPATDPLAVDEASRGDTLPVPGESQPDGRLRLPEELRSPEAIPENAPAPEPTALEPVDPAGLLEGLTPEVAARAALLMQADRLYQAGDRPAAEALYRQAKAPLWAAEPSSIVPAPPITDPAALPPAAAVYWREAQAGAAAGLESRLQVPLELLVQDYPAFLPGQVRYVEYLLARDRAEQAAAVVSAALERYPFSPELLQAQTQVLMRQQKWLEASITARQFTLFNPDHPDTAAMNQLADDNAERFRAALNQQLTGNLLGNLVTGAAGYLLTGGLFGPFTALNSTLVLLQGESGLGERVAEQAIAQLPMLDDDSVKHYVDSIGQKLAALTGRNEFDYDFYVVMDETLNAFALPGGKVFVNAGAILKTESEAELAGLLGHEISHAALSHGFQMVTQGNLTASLAAFIPIPEVAGLAANLAISGYSREMERQADVLGTQVLVAGRYAADGLHNLMVTLGQEPKNAELGWFSSHPAPAERVAYLKQLIDQSGFNRFTYEGVEPHLQVRQTVAQRVAEYQQQQPETAPEAIDEPR